MLHAEMKFLDIRSAKRAMREHKKLGPSNKEFDIVLDTFVVY